MEFSLLLQSWWPMYGKRDGAATPVIGEISALKWTAFDGGKKFCDLKCLAIVRTTIKMYGCRRGRFSKVLMLSMVRFSIMFRYRLVQRQNKLLREQNCGGLVVVPPLLRTSSVYRDGWVVVSSSNQRGLTFVTRL